jgi:hypothetical protein|tara:strand:+ start:4403 stop:4816 length:414 start_codon:yes stop_codon:yes gene_type:complete
MTNDVAEPFEAVTFDTEDIDTDTMHAAGNPTRITITTAGLYVLGTAVEWADNSTGIRSIAIDLTRSGTQYRVALETLEPLSTQFTQSCETIYQCSAADYFEVYAYQNSTGALNIESSSVGDTDHLYSPCFWAYWLST